MGRRSGRIDRDALGGRIVLARDVQQPSHQFPPDAPPVHRLLHEEQADVGYLTAAPDPAHADQPHSGNGDECALPPLGFA